MAVADEARGLVAALALVAAPEADADASADAGVEGGGGVGLALRACRHLLHAPAAAALVAALPAALPASAAPASSGDVAAVARLLASELVAAAGEGSAAAARAGLGSGEGEARTVLRHRAAWMATAVLRAQVCIHFACIVPLILSHHQPPTDAPHLPPTRPPTCNCPGSCAGCWTRPRRPPAPWPCPRPPPPPRGRRAPRAAARCIAPSP
jgi:hypothetical protein